jgi:hypothetical protein
LALDFPTTAGGATSVFSISPLVLDPDLSVRDLLVSLNGILVTNWTKTSTSEVTFTAPLPNGPLVFQRVTAAARKFLYVSGTFMEAGQVNAEFDGVIRSSAELYGQSYLTKFTPRNHVGKVVTIDADGSETLTSLVTGGSLANPGPIGTGAPATGTFTQLTANQITLVANQAQRDATLQSLGVSIGGAIPRNQWLNGNLTVSQRFPSDVTASAGRIMSSLASSLGTSFYILDRIYQSFTGTLPTWNTSRQRHPLGTVLGNDSPEFFMRHAITGTAGTTGLFWGQRIESLRKSAGKTMVFSFWGRSTSAPRTLTMTVDQRFGTGGSPSGAVTVTTQTFSLTSTWTRFSKTFTVPPLSGKTLGTTPNTDFLDFNFSLPVALDSYDFWGFDFREGTVVPDRVEDMGLEFETYRCQRYFRLIPIQISFLNAVSGLSGNSRQSGPLVPAMRAAPRSQLSANDAALTEFLLSGVTTNLSARTPGSYGANYLGSSSAVSGESIGYSVEAVSATAVSFTSYVDFVAGCDAELY